MAGKPEPVQKRNGKRTSDDPMPPDALSFVDRRIAEILDRIKERYGKRGKS